MSREPISIAGIHPSVLRRANSIEIFHAIRLKPDGISQREIAASTGIDKSTVSTIISAFDARGLLSRSMDENSGRRGRPSETLALKPEAGLLIGIDIAPERLLVLSSGIDGKPTVTSTYPPIGDVASVAAAVEAAFLAHLKQSGRTIEEVRAVGVCVPGLVNRSGRLAESANMNWRDVEIMAALNQRLQTPVRVENDARAAGLAEKLFGRCIDVNDYIFIDSHSGVGGALFLDGRIYVGAGGFAGEVGHLKVAPSGRICDCGASGCLSAYVSGPALRRRFLAFDRPVSSFAEMRELAEAGDQNALEALEEAGTVLGVALSDFINLFNPPTVVLGGGLAVLASHLMPSVERALARETLHSPRAQCQIVVSELALQDVPHGPLAVALEGLSQLPGDGAFPW